MLKRVSDALSKIGFCLQVSAGMITFIKLLYYTKRFSWYKARGVGRAGNSQKVRYVVNLNGMRCIIYLRTYAGDIDIFYEIFWRGVYRLPLTPNTPPTIIADIGGNVGMAALYFATRYPGARIICLEPGVDNFSLLQQNCTHFKNIITRHAALLPEDGWVNIEPAEWEYNNKVVATEKGVGAVPGISMDTLFREYQLPQIDLLKMDIEGAEEAVFEGDTGWLKQVRQLLIEIHLLRKNSNVLKVLAAAKFVTAPLHRDGSTSRLYLATNYP